MNKRTKMIAGAGLAALALLLGGGGYYYFHVQTDTPEYAINQISRAIEKHDVKEFHRAVDVNSLLDSGYDGFIEGLTSTDSATNPEAREAIKNFTQMLRAPMIASLKAAIDSYVEKGKLHSEENVGVIEMLERTGLNKIEIHSVKNIQVKDADRDEAFADVMISQPELDGEFPLQILLKRNEDNRWQVTRIENFRDYVAKIAQARRAQLEEYLSKAGEINERHAAIVRDAEQKYSLILATGSLGDNKTREELKHLVTDIIQKDWELRKQELFGLPVPKDAETLHNLYMKVCDLWIAASKDYAKWLDDKNAATIKSAEDKIHQAQTLTTEARAIAKRMTS